MGDKGKYNITIVHLQTINVMYHTQYFCCSSRKDVYFIVYFFPLSNWKHVEKVHCHY